MKGKWWEWKGVTRWKGMVEGEPMDTFLPPGHFPGLAGLLKIHPKEKASLTRSLTSVKRMPLIFFGFPLNRSAVFKSI